MAHNGQFILIFPRHTETVGDVLSRNITVVRGYGVTTSDGTEEGTGFLRQFVEAARKDGYPLVLPSELARMHGSRPTRDPIDSPPG